MILIKSIHKYVVALIILLKIENNEASPANNLGLQVRPPDNSLMQVRILGESKIMFWRTPAGAPLRNEC